LSPRFSEPTFFLGARSVVFGVLETVVFAETDFVCRILWLSVTADLNLSFNR